MPVLGQLDTNKLYSDIINQDKTQLGNVQPQSGEVNKLGDTPSTSLYSEYGVQSQTNLPSDLRKTFMASTVNLGGAVLEGARQVGLISDEFATREQKKGAESAARLTEGTSPQFKREAAKTLIDEEGNFGGFSGTTLLHRLTASAPDIIATIAPAAGAVKLLEGAKWASKLGLKGAVAASATEGLVAGAENANQARLEALETPLETYRKNPLFLEEVSKLDPSIPLEEREEQVRTLLANKVGDDVFIKTTASTGIIGLATGGGAIGNLLNRSGGKITQSYFKAVGKDIGQEALQEFGQSGGEHLIGAEAKKKYVDPSINVNEGLLNAMAEGALVGGVMGGGLGAASNIGAPLITRRSTDKSEAAKGAIVNPLTNEEIKDKGVKEAYSKFQEVVLNTETTSSDNYRESYAATVANLNNIINEEETNKESPDKVANEIRLKEAKDALNVIHQSHDALVSLENKREEAR